MSEDTKLVEVKVGPYARQRLTMSTGDADTAIADGWALDPFAPVDPNAKEPETPTEEQMATMREKADKALRKLRGEPDDDNPSASAQAHNPDNPHNPSDTSGDETRDMAAGESHRYRRK